MPNPEFEIQGTNITPPGGWKYTHENPPFVAQHYDYGAWLKQVQGFFEGNDIPMGPNWVEILHSEACKQNPQWGNFCRRWTDKVVERRPANFASLIQFIKVMGRWLVDGGKLEDQEVAESRASICSQCRFNLPSSQGCGSCMSNLLGGIEKLKGSRKTEKDDSLGACKICSCELKTAVWFPLKAQLFGISDEMKKEFKQIDYCWKRDISDEV